ncbi:MAG: hypothetical protein KAI47_06325 [Deltaproteobacteria bacterium]|nr:hypothetical protein [Deltaproteobacteria bacterium]
MKTRPRHNLLIAALLTVSLITLGACSDDSGPGPGPTPDQGPSQDARVDGTHPSPAHLSPKELLDACVRASACEIKQYPSIYNCIEAYYELYVDRGDAPIYDSIFRCVNQATTCDAVASCFGRRSACDQTTKGSCEGTIAVSCDLIDKRVYTVDCAKAGKVCRARSGGDAICSLGDCAAGFKEHCADGVLQSCGGNAIEVEDCKGQGLRCGKVWYIEAACYGETETKCSDDFVPRCDGDNAVSCVTFREHLDDCTQRTYRKTVCKNGVCTAHGNACVPGVVNRCDGDTLEACLDGEWIKIDCAPLSLGPCKPSTAAGANCSAPKN